MALNFYLKGKKIVILQAEEVLDDFHARFSAVQRSYIYKILKYNLRVFSNNSI
jgi:tRNA pseudouridine38-40 synthase